MALRRHTRALGCHPWQRQPALRDGFLNVQAAFQRRLPTNLLSRGRGQTLRHLEIKICAARRIPHTNSLSWKREQVCFKPEKSSLHFVDMFPKVQAAFYSGLKLQ